MLNFLLTLVLLLCQLLRGAACQPVPLGRSAGARRRAAAWSAVPRTAGPGMVLGSDHLTQESSTGEKEGRKRGFITITRIILKWQKEEDAEKAGNIHMSRMCCLKGAVGFCSACHWHRVSSPPKLGTIREEGLRAGARKKITSSPKR